MSTVIGIVFMGTGALIVNSQVKPLGLGQLLDR
jgi:hypothetical protein